MAVRLPLMQRWSSVVELRQYTLYPGQRGALIDLFEAELVEPQEAVGMKLICIFRDLDDPDRFVWLRGFETMETRARGLAGFYGGPVWARHRNAANATMIDSDNVLLLRPATPGGGFDLLPEAAAGDTDGGVVAVVVFELRAPLSTELASRLSAEAASGVRASGGSPLGFFVTEESQNTYPALPVREGEHVFVSFAGFPGSIPIRGEAWAELAHAAGARLQREPTVLRLLPTHRSRLTAAPPPPAHADGADTTKRTRRS